MPQKGPSFATSCIASPVNKANAKLLALTSGQASSLGAALADDARGSIYSAVVSIADAFSGLQRGYFSWATVKLYYACFYFAKAALARKGICVFYINTSPHYLHAVAGASPVACGGNSHSVVTNLYKSNVQNGVLNAQPIDGVHAFDWVASRREDVNYRDFRFSDPDVPGWFSTIDSLGVRRVVGDYLSDLPLYAYDADHAMVALPLAALMSERSSVLQFPGLGLSVADSTALKAFLSDRSGPIHHFSFL